MQGNVARITKIFKHIAIVVLALLVLGFSYVHISRNKTSDNGRWCRESDIEEKHTNRIYSSSAAGIRLVNSVIADYDADIRHRLNHVIENKAPSNDSTLISLVRDLLDPPSKHMLKTVRQVTETLQSKEIITLVKKKRQGFFVEVGGLDGERSSNTLWLEQHLKWTGLLIEMDPYFYTQLRGKNRKCWSINACVSPVSQPVMIPIKESPGGGGMLSTNMASKGLHIPCFTLESMLLALNTTHIDYFSLDVEGFEMSVLRTIPFDRVKIQTMSVEYVHGQESKHVMKSFMEKQGYRTHKDIHHHDTNMAMFVDDFIFVKN